VQLCDNFELGIQGRRLARSSMACSQRGSFTTSKLTAPNLTETPTRMWWGVNS
jgi:hypothetical protein